MKLTWNRQRTYAKLVGLGICILLFRTIAMLADGSLTVLMPWVSALLVLEFLLDVGTVLGSIWWWVGGTANRAWLPLRFAAAATILHAIRVLIYVLGRTGPWLDFDRRAPYRGIALPEWTWVIFAAILAVLGILGVAIIWYYRRTRRG